MTRRTVFLFLTVFLLLGQLSKGQQSMDKYKSDNVVITFDNTEIIDTIYVYKDSSEWNYARRYNFSFKNSGTEILIISYTGGCDPCFESGYPKDPVKPRQKSIITISCPGIKGQRLITNEKRVFTLTKRWEINSNAKNEVILTVRQIFILKT